MEGAKIGAGWAISFNAIPAWARAQSEHGWPVLPKSLGWKCATATKLVRNTSRTQTNAPARASDLEAQKLRSWLGRVVPSIVTSWGFMGSM
jgi:hypothetical protein